MLIRGMGKKLWMPQSPFVVASSGPPPTGILRVQGKMHQNGDTSSGTVAVTLDAPVGNGNMVCIANGFAGTSAVNITGIDDKGNSCIPVDTIGTGGFFWSSFYLLNITNAPKMITLSYDAGASSRLFSTIIVTEFSGILSAGALDGHSINGNQTGVATANGITSNAATTTDAGDLIWGACVNLGGASTLMKNSTWTQAADETSGQDFNTQYLIQSAAGSIAATWTGTTADNFSSVMMAFKHA